MASYDALYLETHGSDVMARGKRKQAAEVATVSGFAAAGRDVKHVDPCVRGTFVTSSMAMSQLSCSYEGSKTVAFNTPSSVRSPEGRGVALFGKPCSLRGSSG
jgi:hypothetical protein